MPKCSAWCCGFMAGAEYVAKHCLKSWEKEVERLALEVDNFQKQVTAEILASNPPVMSSYELEQFSIKVLSFYQSHFPGKPIFIGDQINVDIIVEKMIGRFGFQLGHSTLLLENERNRTYGRTIFGKNVVEIFEPKEQSLEEEWKLRETIAHEMFHVLVHGDYAYFTEKDIDPKSELERNAEEFPRFFLLPMDRFTNAFKTTIGDGFDRRNTIRVLAERFGAPIQMIEARIEELRLVQLPPPSMSHIILK